MTSCGTDEVVDSINNVSPTSSDPISPPDYCHFTNLHPNIELEILKQLEFQDYRNLALTCKRWYQAAVSAPRSMKPDVRFIDLNMTDGCLNRSLGKVPINIDHNISFNLVNNVKCGWLIIYKEASSDLKNFIVTNRHRFEFEMVVVTLNGESEENYLSMEPLLDMADKILWSLCKADQIILQFLKTHVLHRNSMFNYAGSIECVHLVLKQWVNGERPNLEYFSCDIGASSSFDEVTTEVEEFVQDEYIQEDDEFFCATIVVPGLQNLIVEGIVCNITGDELFAGKRQTVWLKRADVPEPSFF